MGCTAEQTSCRKPGFVSSFVRIPPPMVSAASITNVFHPSRAKAIAALRPLGPEPMMTASYSVRRMGELGFKLSERMPDRKRFASANVIRADVIRRTVQR